MQVPIDRFQCALCRRRPYYLACEACWDTMCADCSDIVWVVRDGKDWAHLLCKECAGEDEEGPQ